MSESDVLAEALGDVMEPPGWQVLGSTMPIRAQAAYRHAAAAILASLDGRGYALVRTPETLTEDELANALDSVDIDEFDTLGAFDSTGYARAILAALPAASPAPDPGAGLRDAAQAVVDSVHGVQYGTSTPRLPVTAESPVHWQVSGAAIDALRAALRTPKPEGGTE